MIKVLLGMIVGASFSQFVVMPYLCKWACPPSAFKDFGVSRIIADD